MANNKNKNECEPVIYVPIGARLNIGNSDMPNIETRYETRRQTFDQDALEQVIKGNSAIYGTQYSETSRPKFSHRER